MYNISNTTIVACDIYLYNLIDDRPLWLDIVALIIIGLSISLALVPTYDKILDAAE